MSVTIFVFFVMSAEAMLEAQNYTQTLQDDKIK